MTLQSGQFLLTYVIFISTCTTANCRLCDKYNLSIENIGNLYNIRCRTCFSSIYMYVCNMYVCMYINLCLWGVLCDNITISKRLVRIALPRTLLCSPAWPRADTDVRVWLCAFEYMRVCFGHICRFPMRLGVSTIGRVRGLDNTRRALCDDHSSG